MALHLYTARRDKRGRVAYPGANFLISKRYHLIKVLGAGSYGTVCSVVDKYSKVELAVKKVSEIFTRETLLKRAVRELKLMKFFRGHRNIVALLDLDVVFLEPYDGLYCFQELVDYDLTRVIGSSVKFSEFHIQTFLYQILCGVKYIHSAEVLHRDLKPGNILITISGTLKICDFGLARGVAGRYYSTENLTRYVATRWYRAPELMLSHTPYSKGIDMWAVGCILAEFYGRRPLFQGSDETEQVFEILKVLGTPPPQVMSYYGSRTPWDPRMPSKPRYRPLSWNKVYPYASFVAHNLMSQLLCWDPRKRLTVEECLAHPFVKRVRNVNEECRSREVFNSTWEWTKTTAPDLKRLLYDEVEKFKREKGF